MAKKKSAAELKEEGAAIGTQLATARKRPVNFALSIGKEGLVLETDIKKPPDVLWRNAKKNGGGAKGAQGQMKVNGKVIELTCEDDDAPTQLPKLAKKFFSERGHPYRILMITPSGQMADEDDGEEGVDGVEEEDAEYAEEEEAQTSQATEELPDDADEEAEEAYAPGESEPEDAPSGSGDPERDALMAEFEALSERVELAKTSVHPGAAKKVAKLSETFLAQVEQNPGKAGGMFKMLSKAVEDAIGFGVSAPTLVSEGPGAGDATSPAEGGADRQKERGAEISKLRSRVDKLLAELA